MTTLYANKHLLNYTVVVYKPSIKVKKLFVRRFYYFVFIISLIKYLLKVRPFYSDVFIVLRLYVTICIQKLHFPGFGKKYQSKVVIL